MSKPIKAKATLEFIEYMDGTGEILPKYEPGEFNSKFSAHQICQTAFIDINNYLSNLNKPKEGESENASEASD